MDKKKVTLARDLPVGPRGGMVKADTTVSLDVREARELVYRGDARWPKAEASPAPAGPEADTDETKGK